MTTKTHQTSDGRWIAIYVDWNGEWRIARNALHHPISCETSSLASSVARHRRRRLKPLK